MIYKKALTFIEEHQLDMMPHAIKILSGYGHLLLHWHQVDKAKDYFKKAIQLGKKTDIYYAHSAYHGLSEAYILENDPRSALATIQELRYQTQGKQDLYRTIHDQQTLAMEARVHLAAAGRTGKYLADLQWHCEPFPRRTDDPLWL